MEAPLGQASELVPVPTQQDGSVPLIQLRSDVLVLHRLHLRGCFLRFRGALCHSHCHRHLFPSVLGRQIQSLQAIFITCSFWLRSDQSHHQIIWSLHALLRCRLLLLGLSDSLWLRSDLQSHQHRQPRHHNPVRLFQSLCALYSQKEDSRLGWPNLRAPSLQPLPKQQRFWENFLERKPCDLLLKGNQDQKEEKGAAKIKVLDRLKWKGIC